MGTDGPGRRRRGPLVAVAVLVVLVAAGVAVLAGGGGGSDSDGGGAKASSKFPDRWDPRLTKLVDFAEKDRGLEFKHPVHVDFLTAEEFKKSDAFKAQQPTEDDKRDIEQALRLLRSFGLIEGDVDLLGKLEQLLSEGTLAYYDPESKRVTVRGKDLTEGVRATLVHELTHTLQDQHFGLEALTVEDQSMDEAEKAGWLRDLAEGDATRVENHWVDTLSPSARDEYEKESTASADDADLSDIPEILVAIISSSYTFGNALVEVLEGDGGNRAVDAAFRSPPVSDEQVFDPFQFLAKDAPATVPTPALRAGETVLEGSEPQSFGSFFLFVTLAQRLDVQQALRATDGWDGDRMVLFSRAGRQCARVELVTDTPADREEMRSALETWAGGMPAGLAKAVLAGERIELESCDPGADYKPAAKSMQEALGLPLSRTGLAISVLAAADGQVPWEFARCYAGRLVEVFDTEQLTSEEAPSADEQRQLEEVAAACR